MSSYRKIDNEGNVFWYKSGTNILHRENGPAIEYFSGTTYWFKDGKYHREDGPAIKQSNGTKLWYKDNFRHRDDGPAIEHYDGYKEWWYNGKFITSKDQETFERIIKLKAFW